MGVTTIPCPKCGQAQTTFHENGQAVEARLCAACAEQEQLDKAKKKH